MQVPSVVKSLSKRLYHDLNDLHEMVLDINKKKQQTGEQKWRFLSQKWGTTISRMVPIQSDLATHKKMARRQHGMLYIAGLQILILILSTARESDMNKHDDFEHLWTTALNTHIYIYMFQQEL